MFRILITAIGGLGDLIRVFPVLSSLRRFGPRARITVLTSQPKAGEIFSLMKEGFRPEEILYWDLSRGFREKLRILYRVRRGRFDLLLDTSRGTGWRGNYRLGRLSGARIKVGFRAKGLGAAYDVSVPFEPEVPIVEQNLSLLKACGLKTTLDFGLREDFPPPDPKGPYLVLHAASLEPGRTPSPAFWKRLVAGLLRNRPGLRLIATGTGEDRGFWQEIPGVKGRFGLSLEALCGLIKGAQLFLGVDSGPLHLAVALKQKTLGLFGPTSPKQVVGDFPLFEAVSARLPCAPCYRHLPGEKIRCRQAACMEGIEVEEVLNKAEFLLNPR